MSVLRLMMAVVLAVTVLAGTMARSQSVVVQSGEHAGFTRLVLDIGASRDWIMTGTGALRTLTLDPPADGFSVAQVFDLIPRTRLSDLQTDPAGQALTMMLACPCDIAAERYRQRYLILDIAPTVDRTGPAADLQTPSAADLSAVNRQAAAERLPDITTLLTSDRPALPLPPTSDPSRPSPAVDMAEAARIMAEQLARAAASGLLDAAPGRPLSDADPADRPAADMPVAAVDPAPETVPGLEPAIVAEPDVPIRAATALDLAQGPRHDPLPLPNDLACAGDFLSIRDWSSGLGVSHGLGALRLAVLDDRDRLQRDGVLALVRHYLFYGFGAEAAYWLGRIENAPADLSVIAALVDGVAGARFPFEADPVACSDEELLWRYLDDALGAEALVETTAGRLQRATAALPQILRDQIGPRVARKLQQDGFVQAARNLRDLLHLGGRLDEAQRLALDLDLGIARPGDAGIAVAVDLALQDDGADPVGAMARALALERELGTVASPLRLTVAEALLRENGIGPQTLALWQELTMAQLAAGDLDRALGLLSSAGAIPQAALDATLTALFADRVAAGDTAALFLLARVHGPAWQASGSDAGRARVGAIALLQTASLMDAADVLRAGQRALILPARPAPPPDPDETLRAAWVVGDWAEVSGRAAGAHGLIAARLIQPVSASPDGAVRPDLPALAARVADSRLLRDEIARLLVAPSPEALP